MTDTFLKNNRFLKISSFFSSCFIILLVVPIIIESIGVSFFSFGKSTYENEARALFFIATVISQTFFSLITNIDGGFILMPVLELQPLIGGLFHSIFEEKGTFQDVLGCLFVANVLSSILLYIICHTNTVSIILRIPKNITEIHLILTAAFNIFKSFSALWSGNTSYSVIMVIISLVITFCAIKILDYYKKPIFVVLYLVSLILIMNILKFVIKEEDLIRFNIFKYSKSTPLVIKLDTSISFSLVTKNFSSIISIAILPILSQTMSLLLYSNTFESTFNIKSEMKKLSLTNLISSVSCLPTHFMCTGSIFFRMCGATTKFHSLISGISLLTLIYIYDKLLRFIPVLSTTFLLQFIGLSIILGYSKIIYYSTRLEKVQFALILLVLVYFKMNIVPATVVGVLINILFMAISIRQFYIPSSIDIKHSNDLISIKIFGALYFYNIDKLKKIKDLEQNLEIDMKQCVYVDYSENSKLYSMMKDKKISFINYSATKNFNRYLLLNKI